MVRKALASQKKAARTSLTKLKKKTVEELQGLDLSQLKVRRNRFRAIGEDLKGIFDQLLSECTDKEIDQLGEEKDELFETIDDMLVQIERVICKLESKVEEPSQPGSGLGQTRPLETNEVKLPTLSLQTFSGLAEEWLSFSDLFTASVTKNPKLSDGQKLQYLRSCLRGDALRVIQSLPVIDSNFKIAWDLLKERYFQKREIFASLLKKLLNITPMSAESPSQLLNLVDSTKECVRMLETLDLKVEDSADTLLMFLIQFKLDGSTRGWWERTLKGEEVPSLSDLLQFLTTHARSITTRDPSGAKKKAVNKRVTLVSEFTIQCPYCKAQHALSKCEAFLKLTVSKRVDFVQANNICFNCLTQFHRQSTCRSSNACRKCKKPHHTLLHFEYQRSRTSRPETVESEFRGSDGLSASAKEFVPVSSVAHNSNTDVKHSTVTSCCSDLGNETQVLLCTAVVRVVDSVGNTELCRALLDPGSQACLITKKCAGKLGLQKRKASVVISCLGASDTRTDSVVQIQFFPHFSSCSSFSASAYVVEKIIGPLPHSSLPSSVAEKFSDLKLADPTFFKSGSIDILLGVDIALPILKGQTISVVSEVSLAVRSELGWIVAGSVPSDKNCTTIHVNNIEVHTDSLVSKFWELESVPIKTHLSSAERQCEEHFAVTHSRNMDGRYVVKLPFHTSPTNLGDTKQAALRRLTSVERSLLHKPEVREMYISFMKEYMELGHMERVEEVESGDKPVNYLPHHCVVKPSSSTTKLRVVYDASSKSSTGLSLNDLLLTGPRVQEELFPILLRFRKHQVALCADIEKMFRQIEVHPDDRDLQRIVWRNSPEEPVMIFRLTTVTYGTSCAPYLATRAIKQLTLDERKDHPRASEACARDFYVDDLLTGANSEAKAKTLAMDISQLMMKGGFNLRKWISNCPSALEGIPDVAKDPTISFDVKSDCTVRVLGIVWCPSSDMFKTSVSVQSRPTWTKRAILSVIAKTFDPLGWLSPVVVFTKILLQELWSCDLDWDDEITGELLVKWNRFHDQLPVLKEFEVPRCVLTYPVEEIQVHGFCDASEKAYCAAVYIRSVASDYSIKVALLTAKTRVAPRKTQSLPRLELCSALLLASLLESVLPALELSCVSIYAWTDSTVTLAWISSEPRRWLPFVANRVSRIQEAIPEAKWNHVIGGENPADCATRGLLPSEFIECENWRKGPEWLRQTVLPIMPTPGNFDFSETQLKEERKQNTGGCENDSRLVLTVLSRDCIFESILSLSNDFDKIVRVIAYLYRFIFNLKNKSGKKVGPLTLEEVRDAETKILVTAQQSLGTKSKNTANSLASLNPFTDEYGILRVGGRLEHSGLAYESKFPIILPKGSRVSELIFQTYHKKNLHVGPQNLLNMIRTKYWPLDGRKLARKTVRSCVTCFKNKPILASQIMVNLPPERVTVAPAFNHVGIDLCGPFFVTYKNQRKGNLNKVYISVFICFVTKAIHLELLSDLTSQCLIATLKRFIARRGRCAKSFTDNAYGVVQGKVSELHH